MRLFVYTLNKYVQTDKIISIFNCVLLNLYRLMLRHHVLHSIKVTIETDVKLMVIECKSIIIGSALVQAAVVSLILYLQRTEWFNVTDELEKRKADEAKRYPSSIKIINDVSIPWK